MVQKRKEQKMKREAAKKGPDLMRMEMLMMKVCTITPCTIFFCHNCPTSMHHAPACFPTVPSFSCQYEGYDWFLWSIKVLLAWYCSVLSRENEWIGTGEEEDEEEEFLSSDDSSSDEDEEAAAHRAPDSAAKQRALEEARALLRDEPRAKNKNAYFEDEVCCGMHAFHNACACYIIGRSSNLCMLAPHTLQDLDPACGRLSVHAVCGKHVLLSCGSEFLAFQAI